MRGRAAILLCLLLLLCSVAADAKSKKKILLADDVLQAQTVVVLADPSAGVDISDPLANRNARQNVESAIRRWERFRLSVDPYSADLIIIVRRGRGKLAGPTIGGVPISNDPITMQAPDPGSFPDGRPPNRMPASGPMGPPRSMGPTPRMEAGAPDDMLSVYRGHRDNAIDYPPVWRYSAKDALKAPDVRAVEEFRKVIAEAEKQRNATP